MMIGTGGVRKRRCLAVTTRGPASCAGPHPGRSCLPPQRGPQSSGKYRDGQEDTGYRTVMKKCNSAEVGSRARAFEGGPEAVRRAYSISLRTRRGALTRLKDPRGNCFRPPQRRAMIGRRAVRATSARSREWSGCGCGRARAPGHSRRVPAGAAGAERSGR